tara:strand:- start:457 stop:768 length:312 start_codon:yes stop_codon:yes gene_type:complete
VQGRYIEMKIFKVEKVFWDRLLKESGKRHWLSVDWSKWKDEDDTDDEFSKMKFGNGSQTFNDFDVSIQLEWNRMSSPFNYSSNAFFSYPIFLTCLVMLESPVQ